MSRTMRPRSEVVSARIDSGEALLLELLAQWEGITASEWIRAAIQERLIHQHADAMRDAADEPRSVTAGS